MNLNNLSDEDMRELSGFVALQRKEDAELFGRNRSTQKSFIASQKLDSGTMVVLETTEKVLPFDFATGQISQC